MLIPFPAGGIHKSFGYRRQPDATTPDALNVRPFDVQEQRARGGSRPGLITAFTGDFFSTISMLEQVRSYPFSSSGQGGGGVPPFAGDFTDDFVSGSEIEPLGSPWGGPLTVAWGVPPPDFPLVKQNGLCIMDLENSGYTAYVDTTMGEFPRWTQANRYVITATVDSTLSDNGTFGGDALLYWGMPGDTIFVPGTVRITARLQAYYPVLKFWIDQVMDVSSGVPEYRGIGNATLNDSAIGTGDIMFELQKLDTGEERVALYWRGNRIIPTSGEPAAILPLPTNYQFGVSLGSIYGPSRGTNVPAFNSLNVQWFVPGDDEPPAGEGTGLDHTVLIAGNNGRIFQEKDPGSKIIPGEMKRTVPPEDWEGMPYRDIQDSALVHGEERDGELFIADFGEIKVSSSQGVLSNGGTVLQDPSLSFLDIPRIPDGWNDVVVITEVPPLSSARPGTYRFSFVDEKSIHLEDSALGDDSPVSYYITRAPKVYNPNTEELRIWYAPNIIENPDIGEGFLDPALNQVPSRSSTISYYRDRMVLAVENVWFMCRQGDPFDWYVGRISEGDSSSAVAGALQEEITATIAHMNDYLVLATANSLWVIRGDPTLGGQPDNLSRHIGIIYRGAWTWGPEGEIYFLGRDGMYMIPPGASGKPQSVSRERIPQELLGLNPGRHTTTDPVAVGTEVLMVYSARFRGINIYITHFPYQQEDQWWFSLQTNGFWRERLHREDQPFSVIRYRAETAERTSVVLGTRSGKLLRYSRQAPRDGDYEFDSHVVMGPYRVSGEDKEGIVTELQAEMDKGSAPVNWELMSGDTSEESLLPPSKASGTFDPGRSRKFKPRVRGSAFSLRLSNQDSKSSWAMESVNVSSRPSGEER